LKTVIAPRDGCRRGLDLRAHPWQLRLQRGQCAVGGDLTALDLLAELAAVDVQPGGQRVLHAPRQRVVFVQAKLALLDHLQQRRDGAAAILGRGTRQGHAQRQGFGEAGRILAGAALVFQDLPRARVSPDVLRIWRSGCARDARDLAVGLGILRLAPCRLPQLPLRLRPGVDIAQDPFERGVAQRQLDDTPQTARRRGVLLRSG
jgi:hypothetical protein